MDSILTSIKVLLGIEPECTQFDKPLIEHINAAFMTLNQLGVGPDNPVFITGDLETWVNKFGDISRIQAIKTYIYIKVKLVFDPPTNSSYMGILEKQAMELEERLIIQLESKEG